MVKKNVRMEFGQEILTAVRLMRSTAAVLLCVCWVIPSIAWTKEITPEEHRLLDELLAANRKRETPFGNMHAIWTKEEVTDGKKVESTIEFWSRENKYFRFDETFTQDGFKVERHFAVPSRYARFASYGPDSRGAITKHDTAEIGRQIVRSQGWFCEANKRLLDPMEDLVQFWLNRDDTTFQVKREPEGNLVITKRREGEGDVDGNNVTFVNSEVLTFSPDDYRFLESKFRLDRSDGTWSEDFSVKNYDDPLSDIPTSSRFEDIQSEGIDGAGSDKSKRIVRYTLKEMQFTPAPMDVFEMPEFTKRSSYAGTRRLILLASGVALLAICFLLGYWRKRQSNSATSA
jgi:hypothetical protein